MSLKDYMKEISTYAIGTGFFDKLKLTADDKSVLIESRDAQDEVFINGKFFAGLSELSGECGLSNLNLLQTITNDPEYSLAESVLTVDYVTKDNERHPGSFSYVNRSQSELYYRAMSRDLVPKQPTFKEPVWDVIVQPTKASIQQFAWAANGLSSYEQYFIPAVKDNKLKFFIGEDGSATQRGGVVFAHDVTGTFASNYKWRISHIQPILKFADTTELTMKFSLKGAIMIVVNTGLAEWRYIYPAKVK